MRTAIAIAAGTASRRTTADVAVLELKLEILCDCAAH
jgi:hypothetical protein